MRLPVQTVGLLCGLMAVALFLVLYATAMSLDSEYEFGENYLSDLGVGDGAWAFNSAVMIAGTLIFPFALFGVRSSLAKSQVDSVSIGLLVVAGLFLVSIGVFTEDAGDVHGFVSYGFFLTMLVAFSFLSYSFDKSGPSGRPRAIVTLVALVMGLGLLPLGGTPLVETVAVLTIIAWGLVVDLLILLRR